MLPIVGAALESPTPSVVDAALRSIPVVLPVLDFSTIKNELFPVIAAIFSKTNSLAIKVRGLQAFVILCGGSDDGPGDDGLDGFGQKNKKTSSSTALDKYTMLEKIVPLVKAIKTKEPAVMMAGLKVLRVGGQIADADFVAMDILPILWSMSLGPLLDLKQLQTSMYLIKTLPRRVEDEQTKKLQELSGNTNGAAQAPTDDFMSFGGITGTRFAAPNGDTEDDFERLVKGRAGSTAANPMEAAWDGMASSTSAISPGLRSSKPSTPPPAFSWSTPSPTTAAAPGQLGAAKAQQPTFRTVTPDLASIATLAPSSTQFSQPLQPAANAQSAFPPPPPMQNTTSGGSSINWSTSAATGAAVSNPWAAATASSTPAAPAAFQAGSSSSGYGGGLGSSMASMSLGQRPGMGQSQGSSSSSFSLPPPPGGGSSGFSLAPPPAAPQAQTQSTPS